MSKRTLVVIQARSRSTRFPNKVWAQIAGRSVLEHVVTRARYSGYATVVALPRGEDDLMARSADMRASVPDHRGRGAFVPVYVADREEGDVLGRFMDTVLFANSMSRFLGGEGFGCIVRLTADCPFVPVSAIDAVAEAVVSGGYDYCETRSDPSSRPNGIDAQAFTPNVLFAAEAVAVDPSWREHITPAVRAVASRAGRLPKLEGVDLDSAGSFSVTLDTPKDLAVLERIAQRLAVDPGAGRPTFAELARLHATEPELFTDPE